MVPEVGWEDGEWEEEHRHPGIRFVMTRGAIRAMPPIANTAVWGVGELREGSLRLFVTKRVCSFLFLYSSIFYHYMK